MKPAAGPLLTFVWLWLAAACSPSAPEDSTGRANLFPIEVDGVRTTLELALTPEEQAEGLMHRGKLGEDEGMLFVYSDAGRRSFWMLNTMIPLDLGHFDSSGVLLEVLQLRPNDTTSVPSTSDRVQFSLEMNQGWFERRGIRPGARISLRQIAAAIHARGGNPERFGLARQQPVRLVDGFPPEALSGIAQPPTIEPCHHPSLTNE